MRDAAGFAVVQLDPSDVRIGQRQRPVTDEGVETLAGLISQAGGILTPVKVRDVPASGRDKRHYSLIAGAHRVEAARRLSFKVPAQVIACTAAEARMIETSDQLAILPMTALEIALMVDRHANWLVDLGIATDVNGFAGNQYTGKVVPDKMSATTLVAKCLAVHERTIRRWRAGVKGLKKSEIKGLASLGRGLTKTDLDQLGKIGSSEDRSRVVESLISGSATTVASALSTLKNPLQPPKRPDEEAFKRLLDAWNRAPKSARRQFVDARGDDLRKLLDGQGAGA